MPNIRCKPGHTAGQQAPKTVAKAVTPSKQPVLKEKQSSDNKGFGGFIGTSVMMQKVYEQIEAAAKSQATVFITGESGTGKEVCAEAIHKHSPRRDKAFIPINCAAIPRDLMESEIFGHVKGAFTGAITDREGAASMADGGTLFLDEVAEMTPNLQTKLLRFLQNLTFQKVGSSQIEKTDIRIICATNRNPLDEIHAGRFREDLFYRLHVLPIYMPPLRERDNDIIDIALVYLKQFAEEEGKQFQFFSPDAEEFLMRYNWPGNIRQLQNVVRNIVVMNDGQSVTQDMLPQSLLHHSGQTSSYHQAQNFVAHSQARQVIQPAHFASLPQQDGRNYNTVPPSEDAGWARITDGDVIRPLDDIERDVIEYAITLYDGNIPKAAAALGVSPSTIYRKKMAWDDA